MEWSGIVIHHSVSGDVSWKEIDKWHRDPPNFFNEIGYHFVVRRNGFIEVGRSLGKQGAHARNPLPSRNPTHIGIVWTGHGGEHSPTLGQVCSLAVLVGGLMDRFGIGWDKVEGHHEECPGKLFPWEGLKFKVDFMRGGSYK